LAGAQLKIACLLMRRLFGLLSLWVPKTRVTWADALLSAVFPRPVPASRSWPVRACDDLRLVGLKLIFLTVSSAMSLLRLSRREEWRKDAEILMLRHQLAVAPRCCEADMAGPGVAGSACRDAAHRPPRRDAADRHPGYDLALAP